MPRHIDVSPPHVDAGPRHIDIPPPHIDSGPRHIDIPMPHADVVPRHIDIPPPHIDLGHIDLPHIDVGQLPPGKQYPHIDIGHVHRQPLPPGSNHWWQNWPKTHGYVAKRMFFPTSVDEIADNIKQAEADGIPFRAFGGGWSFSEAVIPGSVTTDRPTVAVLDGIAKFLPLAEGFPPDNQASIAAIDPRDTSLIAYDASNVRTVGAGAANAASLEALLQAPEPEPVYLMNTRSLKSTLQAQLQQILSPAAIAATAVGAANQKYYFHVEGGITMEELAPLLDSQSPRLQVGASGGNPGATLAGSLSTATHGAEFAPGSLLIDRVRAIHCVGPGGQQWWIEGDISIADPAQLLARYPGLDAAHIISGSSPVNGLMPQDWLNAVAVSLGCIAVIYSMVIEVFAIEGAQQVTTQNTWFGFLDTVKSQNPALQAMSAQQLQNLLRSTSDPLTPTLNTAIASAIESGVFSNGVIAIGSNTYADLAFNPNPAPPNSMALAEGDRDCWIVNRQTVPVPFDPQPPSSAPITQVVTTVITQLMVAFGATNNQTNLANLVIRLAEVYGISNPFHVDIPLPHIDIPSPHIDIPSPHIDIPSPHIDVGHLDIHADFSFIEHVDIEFAPHIDIPSPHIDIPSPHIDIPSPHIDVPIAAELDNAVYNFVEGLTNPLAQLITSIFHWSPAAAPIINQLITGGFDLSALTNLISRIGSSHDTLDVALDAITAPMANAQAMDLAQPFLTGFLAATLGTDNPSLTGISVGTGVGAIGFPASGLVGAGIEIALPVETAFSFMQTHVLDQMSSTMPLFGYISVRLCPQTTTLLGMQQWPTSVMIEVVGFGDAWGIQFVKNLQAAALQYIGQADSKVRSSKDAMLHWGLENDQMKWQHLQNIPALNQPTVTNTGGAALSKLDAFRLVRSLIRDNNGANPTTLFRTFDSDFITRLRL